ncbi:HNH endonuclease [bacterium]|nr:HNH endonuclease [bacterium]
MNRRVKHGPCALCKRTVPLTFHHLVPRKLHKRKRFAKRYTRDELNEGIMICQRCHKGLHKLYSEMELGTRLSTIRALHDDEAVVRHIAWVAKQKS